MSSAAAATRRQRELDELVHWHDVFTEIEAHRAPVLQRRALDALARQDNGLRHRTEPAAALHDLGGYAAEQGDGPAIGLQMQHGSGEKYWCPRDS